MNHEDIRHYCLTQPGVTESLPFGQGALVFKVMDKMFALLALDSSPATVNLKCDPERAVLLRQAHPAIQPGYHMNKQHWNTVDCESGLPAGLITELIDHSYALVVQGLPRRVRAELDALTR